MIIIYIDIVLLIILLFLVLSTCGYCIYRVHRLQQNGQVILLKPMKVLFSHRKEGESTEELRTVVAYQNPFTGDYCIHKSRVGPKGYVNSAQIPDSPDSGVSDEYEPLNLVPRVCEQNSSDGIIQEFKEPLKRTMNPAISDNSVNKTWNWNYTEYQI